MQFLGRIPPVALAATRRPLLERESNREGNGIGIQSVDGKLGVTSNWDRPCGFAVAYYPGSPECSLCASPTGALRSACVMVSILKSIGPVWKPRASTEANRPQAP